LGSKKGSTARALQLAKEYLMKHPSASTDEIAKNLGISPRSVTSARKVLVSMGLMARSPFDHKSKKTGQIVAVDGNPGEIMDKMVATAPNGPNEAPRLPLTPARELADIESAINRQSGEPLTTDEIRRRYSRIARWAATNSEWTLEISAITALAKLDQQLGARNALGPGPALTRPEKVRRGGAIIDALGPSMAAEAVIAVFEKPLFDRFIDELGRFMVRKAERQENGVEITQSAPEQGGEAVGAAGMGPEEPDSGPEVQPEAEGDPSGPRSEAIPSGEGE